MNKKAARGSLESDLPGEGQRGINKAQDLLSWVTGIASESLEKGFHLSKFSFTFLQARRHDAMERLQLQFHSRKRVASE